jgi:hypothetical protein
MSKSLGSTTEKINLSSNVLSNAAIEHTGQTYIESTLKRNMEEKINTVGARDFQIMSGHSFREIDLLKLISTVEK